MNRKNLRRLLAASLAVGAFTFAPNFYNLPIIKMVQAEVKMYSGVGEDYPSQIENLEVSRLRAVDKAVKSAVEKAGVALSAYSRAKNFNLTENEIVAITSNTYEIIGEPKCEKIVHQVTDVSAVVIWRVTVNVNVDDAEIMKWIQRDSNDKKNIKSQFKETQKADAENDKKIEDLRKRLATETDKYKLKAEFEQADKEFLVNQKIKEGNKFYANRYYNEAIKCYNEALEIDPNSEKAYIGRAKSNISLSHYNKALEDYKTALKFNPKNWEIYYGLDIIYSIYLKEYENAIKVCDDWIKANVNLWWAYYSRSWIYEKMEYYDNAISDAKQAIKINPKAAWGYFKCFDIYKKLYRYDEAIQVMRKVIKINPEPEFFRRQDAYDRLAQLYVELQNPDQALDCYTESIEVATQPEEQARSYEKRGDFYRSNLKQFDKAKLDYMQAIEIYTSIIENEKEPKTILKYYQKRAPLYERVEQYNEALEDYSKSIKINGRDEWSYGQRGRMHYELKQYEKAILDFTKAIELEPGKASLYWERGCCYRALGETEKMNADFEKYEKLKY